MESIQVYLSTQRQTPEAGGCDFADVSEIFALAIDAACEFSPMTAAVSREASARHQKVARSRSERLAATTAAAGMLSVVKSRTKARQDDLKG